MLIGFSVKAVFVPDPEIRNLTGCGIGVLLNELDGSFYFFFIPREYPRAEVERIQESEDQNQNETTVLLSEDDMSRT